MNVVHTKLQIVNHIGNQMLGERFRPTDNPAAVILQFVQSPLFEGPDKPLIPLLIERAKCHEWRADYMDVLHIDNHRLIPQIRPGNLQPYFPNSSSRNFYRQIQLMLQHKPLHNPPTCKNRRHTSASVFSFRSFSCTKPEKMPTFRFSVSKSTTYFPNTWFKSLATAPSSILESVQGCS